MKPSLVKREGFFMENTRVAYAFCNTYMSYTHRYGCSSFCARLHTLLNRQKAEGFEGCTVRRSVLGLERF